MTKSLESSTDKRGVRRGISLVEAFIDQQKEDVDEIVFNSLLNVLGQTGDMVKLQQTLNKMNDYGVAPSAVTFGTVVKAYGRARDTESVIKVWHQMRSRCLGINPVTCGCVLDACVKCNSLDKAMAIFQEMRMQGMHKNTVLYATLIKGLAKMRDLQGAMNLYHEMRMEQVPCNLVTFNSLMDVCVRCSDLQTAAYFLQDMMQMGIEPDLITFSTLIKGYSQIGQVQERGKGNSQGQGTSGRNPRSQSGGGQEGSIRAEGPDLERSFQAGQTTARLVAQDAAAVVDSHPGPGRADMARGGGKAGEPPARDANQAGNLLEIRYLKSAIQNLGDEGLMEARSSGWRRRATGYMNSGARNRSVWWKTPSARLCGRRS